MHDKQGHFPCLLYYWLTLALPRNTVALWGGEQGQAEMGSYFCLIPQSHSNPGPFRITLSAASLPMRHVTCLCYCKMRVWDFPKTSWYVDKKTICAYVRVRVHYLLTFLSGFSSFSCQQLCKTVHRAAMRNRLKSVFSFSSLILKDCFRGKGEEHYNILSWTNSACAAWRGFLNACLW